MRPIVAITVFFSLMIPSLFLGYMNYRTAKENIIEDINQALVKTVLSSHPERITADTLRVFKSNLQISRLKETSYLSLCTDEPSKVSFCSDTVSFRTTHERLYIRAYPNCSRATIFSLSEQTIPSALLAASLLWGMLSLLYLHQKRNAIEIAAPAKHTVLFGNLSFSASSSQFYNEQKEEIYFTSMQQRIRNPQILMSTPTTYVNQPFGQANYTLNFRLEKGTSLSARKTATPILHLITAC